MNTDSYFQIGTPHISAGKPAQDYAFSYSEDDVAWVVLSDGCSSGDKTDVGARLVTLSTANIIHQLWQAKGNQDFESRQQEVLENQNKALNQVKNALSLNMRDMLATCLFAQATPSRAYIHVQGDGVIALKYKTGKVIVHRFEWNRNAPYYPIYSADNQLSEFRKLQQISNSDVCVSQETWVIDNDSVNLLSNQGHTLQQGIEGISLQFSDDEIEDLEFIALFSDGITQIKNTSWLEAIKIFLAYKNTRGEFVKRRCIRGIKNLNKNGHILLDDFSCAVIKL